MRTDAIGNNFLDCPCVMLIQWRNYIFALCQHSRAFLQAACVCASRFLGQTYVAS